MADYIPKGDESFLTWAENLISYAGSKAVEFKIDDGVLTPLQVEMTAYKTAFTKASDPNRGKVDVLNKNKTRDALKKDIRCFVKSYLAYNPAVSDEDKERLGLPLYDITRTPTPVPKTIPELGLDSSVIRLVTVHFRDAGSRRRGKPAKVHGIELRWAVLDTPPLSVDGLTKSAFDTASPYTFTFDESDRGKALYICPCWENSRGDKGPFGEIVKAIIP
jgi:hypothetical protein